MTELLLAEELFLLSHDDESGKRDARAGVATGLAGALLLDLASAKLVTVDKHRLVPGPEPAAHPLLEETRARLAAQRRPRRATDWVTSLPGALRPLERRVGRSLVERGILTEQPAKVIGLFGTIRWPARDPLPEQRLRAELAGALTADAEPPERAALLIGLLEALGVTRRLLRADLEPDVRRRALSRAHRLAREGRRAGGVPADVAWSVYEAQQAIMSATVASVPTASAAPPGT